MVKRVSFLSFQGSPLNFLQATNHEPKANMDPKKEPSFEQLLSELQDIAAQLEAGNTPLDESLALYEKGVTALKRCHALLDKAEKRIRMLVQDAAGGAALREAELPRAAPPSADSSAAPAPAQDAPKTRKRSPGPAVDTQPPARQNENSSGESAQGPRKAAGSVGGSLFGGAQ